MNPISNNQVSRVTTLTLVILIAMTGLQAAAPRRVAPSQGTTASRSAHGSRNTPRNHRIVQGHANYGRYPWARHSYIYRDDWCWGWPWWSLGGYWGWPYYVYGGPTYAVYPTYPAGNGEEPAAIQTNIRPRKATVRLDGEEVGQARDYSRAWDELLVEPGTHWLEFGAPGHKMLRVRVDTRAGRHYRVDFRLSEGMGADERSDVPPLLGAETPPATRLGDGRSQTRSRSQAAMGRGLARGFLRIQAAPDDSAVYLDGEFLARAAELARMHGALPVAVGEHRVEVVCPGYKSTRRDIVVEEGKPVESVLNLEQGD